MLSDFYSNPVRLLPIESFGEEYMNLIDVLSSKVKDDFDANIDCDNDNIMMKHNNIWKFHEELLNISDIIVPYLEENRYGCHLYVDKIYIYRTLKLDNRVSSYEWHYDNNPDEVVKTLIYLNDVTEENSPYEYLQTPTGTGILGQCTRKGTQTWYPAPNNSRVGHLIEGLTKQGCAPKKVTGKKSHSDIVYKQFHPQSESNFEGYRDVINIRVKPTLQKAPAYTNPMFTTSYEITGVVNQNPAPAWTVKH